jgi:uncharacterized protein (TIGR03435 family)
MKMTLVLFLLAASGALAQSEPLAFEVASVKPADPALSNNGGSHSTRASPGRIEVRNLYLTNLITWAFRLNSNQVVGGPGWMGTAGWDIDAKLPAGASPTRVPEMMQILLAERFHLVYHRETRTLPLYELVVAKNGFKLREAISTENSMSCSPTRIRYKAGMMSDLAAQLTSYLQRQVVDKTELKGRYDMDFSFAPVDLDPSLETASKETRPSIFTALEQQLGLHLNATKGPVEVLVVDGAEKATGN